MVSSEKRRQWLINNMRRAVAACEKRGVDDFLQAWDGAALLDEDAATGLLKDVASSIVARESEAVGLAAAEFYDELRALEVESDGFTAEPVSADFGRVQEAAENLLTRYAESEEARRIVFNALKNAISGWISNAEKETIAQNAKRDKKKALYAFVPSSSPCAFCAVMASRGLMANRKAKEYGRARMHDNCSCLAVPAWHATVNVWGKGKRPEFWEDYYYQAEEKLRENGATNINIRDVCAEMRRQNPAMFKS